jgi:hypothetical protein
LFLHPLLHRAEYCARFIPPRMFRPFHSASSARRSSFDAARWSVFIQWCRIICPLHSAPNVPPDSFTSNAASASLCPESPARFMRRRVFTRVIAC